jgi:hypothetical protein
MRIDDIRELKKTLGGRGFVKVLAEALVGRDASGKECRKLDASKVSFQALWEGLVGPMSQTLGDQMSQDGLNYVEIQEAIDSTSFPSATGMLIASRVIEGYNSVERVGDRLVTVMQSRLKSERVVGFTALEGPTEVPEGLPYQESGFTEKYVTTETAKKGRIIEVTEETIFFDQTGQILRRASMLGEATAQEREKTILGGVLDVGSGVPGYKDVWRPQGVATPLYSAANGNFIAAATNLVDWTAIDAALQFHAANIRDDRQVVGEQEPILWNPRQLLVARRKMGTASRILSATEHRSQPGAADATNVLISGNPLTSIIPGLSIVSSPLIDYAAGLTGSRYDDSFDWFLGDFPKQFIWQEIWPLQTMRSRQDDEANFRRDILARFKVRYYGGIAALDNKYVLKINGTA